MKMMKIEKWFVNSEKHARSNIKILENLLNYIELGSISRVLEIGCGTGSLSAYLVNKHDLSLVGTDVDPAQIEQAIKSHGSGEKLRFSNADATSLPFGNTEFDMILSFKVLHHIRSWQSVLGEINRVIKPNGFCIVNDISFSNFTSRVLKGITKNLRVCTVEDIARYFQLKHFEMVHKESPKGVLLKHYSMVFQKR